MKRNKELNLGLIMLATGVIYFALTLQIPVKGMVDARTFPFAIAALLVLLGIAQTWQSIHTARTAEEPQFKTPSSKRPVVQTCGLLLAFAVLLEPLGFIPTSALYIYFQAMVLTPPYKSKRPGLYALVALITSSVVFFLFRFLFDMMLPVGILSLIGL